MNTTFQKLSFVAVVAGIVAGAALGDGMKPKAANTITMDMRQAEPALNSWRKGQGWVIATMKTAANGDRYVKYRVVTNIHGTISVNRKADVLLTTAAETAWIPLRILDLPTQSGPAGELLRKTEKFLKDNAEVYVLGETGEAQRSTLPQLIKTIRPTVRQ